MLQLVKNELRLIFKILKKDINILKKITILYISYKMKQKHIIYVFVIFKLLWNIKQQNTTT